MSSVLEYLRFLMKADRNPPILPQPLKDWYDFAVDGDRTYYAFAGIEHIRKTLKSNNEELITRDLGTGGKSRISKKKVNSIASKALSSPYQCRILFRTILFYKCKTVLELGTSLGISTAYFASAGNNVQIHTIDGDPASHSIARKVFKDLGFQNIHTHTGSFEALLTPVLEEIGKQKLDFVFMDGNHTYEDTVTYFEKITEYVHPGTIIVIDDIYWSKGMKRAWNELKKRPIVTCSLDLYFCGILFLDKFQKEQKEYVVKPLNWFYHWRK